MVDNIIPRDLKIEIVRNAKHMLRHLWYLQDIDVQFFNKVHDMLDTNDWQMRILAYKLIINTFKEKDLTWNVKIVKLIDGLSILDTVDLKESSYRSEWI